LSDLDFAPWLEDTVPHVDLDFVFLHEECHTFAHAVGHTAAALDDPVEIGLGIRDLDPIIRSVFDVFEDLGTFEQGLGRNAAPIEADSAQRFAFNDSHLEAQL